MLCQKLAGWGGQIEVPFLWVVLKNTGWWMGLVDGLASAVQCRPSDQVLEY